MSATLNHQSFAYMGYSSRDASYRYTLWLPWDGTKLLAQWNLVNGSSASSSWQKSSSSSVSTSSSSVSPTTVFEELYDHVGDNGTDFDGFENDNLLNTGVENATVVAARARMLAAVEGRFRPA
jgi:hypothetical protein